MFEARTMFDASTILADESHDTCTELEALDSAFQPLAAPPVAPVAPINHGFQFPRRLWGAMFACYAIFFAAIFLATGGSGPARFAIVVSALYTVVYFGVARIGARQAGREVGSPLDRGQPLATWTGPMSARAVYGQVLVVPIALVVFSVGVALVCAFTL